MRSVIRRGWACFFLAVAFIFGVTFNADTAQQPPGQQPTASLDANALYFCFQGKIPETRLVVVDKARQRIMVFRYMGEMVLEYEFPCATGTQAGNKQTEGDERTPEGIYFTTHRYQDRKVTIFGDRAIHLNFPNPFDKVAGRKGNGIYIHGTNQKFRPRSTNGCVVLRNEDLARLYSLIKEHLTPVVVVDRLKLADSEQRVDACNFLLKMESVPMGRAPSVLADHISLNSPLPNQHDKFADLGPRLTGLRLGKGAALETANQGLMLLGLAGEWVLVADQKVRGDKKTHLDVVRRFYLKGPDPLKADMVQSHWIVPDTAAALRLSSWAPKTVEVASAKATSVPAPNPEREIRLMLADWLKAWQNKDLRHYLRYYAPDFKGDGMDRKAWGKRKAYLNRTYKVIRVKADDIKVEVNGAKATVVFKQTYRSDWHQDEGRKELRLVLIKGNWRILEEKWEKLSG